MTAIEVNFDGLVGPTHHYGGLGRGNLASQRNALAVSNPRAAALQGLDKMAYLVDRGLLQGILLPHDRPDIPMLRRFGFIGTEAEVLAAAFRTDAGLVSAASSASAMWTANAATVTPSPDALDAKVHFTPANLASHLHRSRETRFTGHQLRTAFPGERFVVHAPIPAAGQSGDEGAANHTRLTAGHHGDRGFAVFVHGAAGTKVHSPRQSEHASAAVARQHQLSGHLIVAQSARAVDAGVFHNDVIAVGDRDLLLAHEEAFVTKPEAVARAASDQLGAEVRAAAVPARMLPIEDAVSSYFFNSQLLGLPDGTRLLLAPQEVRENPRAAEVSEWILTQGVDEVHTMDLRQSMANGGGPACLRLRVVLTAEELRAVHPGFLVDPPRIELLREWVNRHYRETLHLTELGDPALLDETRHALDELTQILEVGALYDFQQ